MPYCPQCGAEYREGVRTCSDCGVALTEQKPPEVTVPTIDEPLAVAFLAQDDAEAGTARALLTEAHIPFVEQEASVAFLDHVVATIESFYARFLVPASRAEEAKELIEGYLAAPDIPEDSQ